MKTVQARFHLVFVAFLVCFLAGLSYLYFDEKSDIAEVLTVREADMAANLQRMVELRTAPLTTLAKEYSRGDDIVLFMATGDRQWAKEHLDLPLGTHGAAALWVLRPDRSLVYSSRQDASGTAPEALIMSAQVSSGTTGDNFRHYFAISDSSVWEVIGAPIQPTADSVRRSDPYGYLFAARYWDADYLAALTHYADARLHLEVNGQGQEMWESDPSMGMVRYTYRLRQADGTPLGRLCGETESHFLKELYGAMANQMWTVVLFAAAFLVLLGCSVYWWVTRPLAMISAALAHEDAALTAGLEKDRSEFGRVSSLVSQFFSQKRDLIKEIGERARAEEALIELTRSHESLLEEQRLLLENTRDFLYRHDTYGVFHYMSPSVETVTGFTPEEWFKHYTTYLTDDPINLKVVEHTEKTLRDGTISAPYMVEIYHKQGQRIRLEVSEQPYFHNGKVAGIVGVARDVTERWKSQLEREQLQTQLDKAQRMESLAMLAGGVAHDLNNTLGPLVAYPDLILEKLPVDSPVKGQVMTVKKAASQAAAIIYDLLTLARRGRYEMEPIDLNEVVEAYVNSPSYLDLCERSPLVRPVIDLSTEKLRVNGSASHLSTALMNLVVNAFDAMPRGGQLTLRTRRSKVTKLASGNSPIQKGEYVVLTVEDTGVGISHEDIDKIFEPYYSKKKMGRSGTGLGLAVVYGIVKDHRGFYDIVSSPGDGTRFSLLFPLFADGQDRKVSEATAFGGSETILIVDDDVEQRQMTSLLLKSLGYQTVAAAEGREAVRLVMEQPPELVVLDMIMGSEYDGLVTYQEILKVRPNQKAIIVSGFSPTERVDEMQQLGAGEFVRKPYTREQLAKAVRLELDRTTRSIGMNREAPQSVSTASR
ncbi:MAG: ATP-binding protein [Candidatus Zixiibacteriota bacterium]